MTLCWEMTVETALEFYERCIARGATTQDEKIEILMELAEEGKMKSIMQTKRTPDEIAKDAAKNYGDVLYISPKKKDIHHD